MKWDDYKPMSSTNYDYEATEIECPECGHYLMRYIREVLTTYPAKYRYECPNCNWIGVK